MPEPRAAREPLVAADVVEPRASDMAVVVGAETTLSEVNRRLAEHNQWLPLDGEPSLTLGQLACDDSTGPLRLGFGGWRDLLTGCQFRDGRGRLITAGGLPVKNVAGYDLCKFLVGSHGCFGAPASFTLRTVRKPEAAMAVTVTSEAGEVGAWVHRLLTGEAPPSWLLWTPNGLRAGWLGRSREIDKLLPVATGLIGTEPERRSPDEDDHERRARLGVKQATADQDHVDGIDDTVRLSVPPADVVRIVTSLQPDGYAADPVFGVAWVTPHNEHGIWDATSAAQAKGGHAVRLRAGETQVYGLSRDVIALLQRLKHAFDPDQVLPPLPVSG